MVQIIFNPFYFMTGTLIRGGNVDTHMQEREHGNMTVHHGGVAPNQRLLPIIRGWEGRASMEQILLHSPQRQSTIIPMSDLGFLHSRKETANFHCWSPQRKMSTSTWTLCSNFVKHVPRFRTYIISMILINCLRVLIEDRPGLQCLSDGDINFPGQTWYHMLVVTVARGTLELISLKAAWQHSETTS